MQGLRGDFEIKGGLRRVEMMAKYITKCIIDRGLVNKANSFFFQHAVKDGQLTFAPPNCVYEPVHAKLDKDKKRAAQGEEAQPPLSCWFLAERNFLVR